jgi:hypothetical protein
MNKLLLTLTVALFAFSINSFGQACPGNVVTTNPAFASGLTGWSQYGNTATATTLTATNGCLNNFLALQATNNSDVGVSQPVIIKQDSCYDLCYCVEFPFVGALFNTKLVIAVTNGSVTSTQLLSGAFTASQAQIIDVINGNNGFTPITQCPPTFTATGNFTTLVIVNQTIGNLGTDVRVDNVCLLTRACPNSCAGSGLVPSFTYTQGPGLQINFNNTSTVNFGYTMSFSWDFGDPGSGPLNTSTLTNPIHLYPAPAIYFVCLYVTVIDPNGVACPPDTFCIDVIVQPTGVAEIPLESLIKIMPNPANDLVTINSLTPVTGIQLYNSVGQMVHAEKLQGTTFAIPTHLPVGVYSLVLNTAKGQAYKKLVISR